MKKEKEIDLIAVLFDCLLHWRGALCFFIAGAVILGGYGYYKSYKESKKSIVVSDEAKYTNADEFIVSSEMKLEEVAKVEALITQKKYLASLESYHNYFNYDNIDYMSVPESEIIFAVSSDGDITSKDAAEQLLMFARSNEYIEYVKDNFDDDFFFVQEMVEGKVQDKTEEKNEDDELKEKKADTCLLEIAINHSNEGNCKKLAKLMKEFLVSKFEEEKGINVEVVGESFLLITDYNVLSKVKSIEDGYSSTRSSIAKEMDAFSDNQKILFDIYDKGIEENAEDETENVESNKVAKGSINVKYVGIGALLFLCMYCGVLVLINFIFNNKLREEDLIEEIYSVKLLGEVRDVKQKKKFLGFVDRLILKIKNGKRRTFSEEESLDILSSSVKIAAIKNEVSEVIAIGCNLTNISDVTKKLYEKLASQNIKVSELDNILYNPENMSKLPGNKACIIIEQIGGTMYDELEKELKVLKSQDIVVLGVVTVAK